VPQPTEFSLVQKAFLIMFFGLFFYVWGAANLEGLLNYPFWRDMGPMMTNEDFIKLRSDHLWKIAPLLVLPVAVLAMVTLSLVFLGPPSIPRWALIAILCLELISVLSTIFIQIPIQFQHNREGYDLASFNRLITTDFWFRKLPRFIEAPFVVFVLWRVISRPRVA
jgi:hypothetical protein